MASIPQRTECVYLLVNADGSRFKIGRTSSLPQRILQLGGKRLFDLHRSIVLALSGASASRDAMGLERTMHFLYRDSNSPLEDRTDGFSEWFDIACFTDVREFIEREQKKFGPCQIHYSLATFLMELAPPASPSIGHALTREERQIKRAEAYRIQLQFCIESNENSIAYLQDFISNSLQSSLVKRYIPSSKYAYDGYATLEKKALRQYSKAQLQDISDRLMLAGFRMLDGNSSIVSSFHYGPELSWIGFHHGYRSWIPNIEDGKIREQAVEIERILSSIPGYGVSFSDMAKSDQRSITFLESRMNRLSRQLWDRLEKSTN